MLISLVFEGIVAALLVLTIIYCWRLDQRLKALRSGQDGVRNAITDLIEATGRAEQGIAGLRETSTQIKDELDERIRAARQLAKDLQKLERQTAPASFHHPIPQQNTAPAKNGLIDRLKKAS